MKKSFKKIVPFGLLGVICLQCSSFLLAQEDLISLTVPNQADKTTADAEETTSDEDIEKISADGSSATLSQNGAASGSSADGQNLAPLTNDFQGTELAMSQSQPYWAPEADPSISALEAGLAPLDYEDPSEASPLFQEEETFEETESYQNPWSMLGSGEWFANTVGTDRYAPVGLPSGFDSFPGGFPIGGRSSGLLSGFSLAATLSGMYDSNVTRSSGFGGRPVVDDFITSLGGSLSYMSRARVWTFGGSYSGSYNIYADNSDFNGYTQNGALVGNYNGGKLSASLTTGLSTGRGGNRNLGISDFVEQTQINVSLAARYVYSTKTTISADAGHRFSTASGGNFSDTRSTNLGLAALWRYSPLTEFGPGIRFTRTGGGGNNNRTSLGPTLNLNYKATAKLSANARVGLDFVDYSQAGSSDSFVSASIGVNYQASPLWGMNLALFRDAQADPSVAGSFRESTAIRLGYTRKIRRASLGLGLSYENSTAANGQPGVARPDRDFFSIDGSIGMLIFANTTSASAFIRYSDQSAGATESYDAFQTGFSLSRSF